MELIEGLKMQGRGVEIPRASRDDLPALFKQLGFKVGAEIGVAEGEFSEKFCKAGMKMYCVDPWEPVADYKRSSFKERLSKEYEVAKKRLESYESVFVRTTSMEAVKGFLDESLDFVYIDAHHGFKQVIEDIYEWSKKVRKGGIISGHDYVDTKASLSSPYVVHVKTAVNAYTKIYGIDNWYILGLKNEDGRDKRRSWMWIKQ